MSNYRDLRVWQEAMKLTKEVYLISNQELFAKDFGLKDQIRRAAVSIPSNIAEGEAMESPKQCLHFLTIARGSNAEVRTQLEIAYEIGYLTKEAFDKLGDLSDKIGASLTNLIKYRLSKIKK